MEQRKRLVGYKNGEGQYELFPEKRDLHREWKAWMFITIIALVGVFFLIASARSAHATHSTLADSVACHDIADITEIAQIVADKGIGSEFDARAIALMSEKKCYWVKVPVPPPPTPISAIKREWIVIGVYVIHTKVGPLYTILWVGNPPDTGQKT